MSVAARAEAGPLSDAGIVEAYLTASMIPDPDAAAAYMAPGTVITFTGGREFDHPRGPTAFNAKRYRWVKKKMDRFDVCPGDGETVVYSVGTLYRGQPLRRPLRGAEWQDHQDGRLERQRRAHPGPARHRRVTPISALGPGRFHVDKLTGRHIASRDS